MTIRTIAPSDLTDLVSLCRDHAAYEQLPFSENDQVRNWQSAFFGSRPRLFGWVCEAENALMGYMTATIDYSTWSARQFVYLDCLYLRQEVRRQGIGRALMSVLADFARAHDCDEIQWQTPPTNELGLAFYRAIEALELPKVRFTLQLGVGR